MLILMPVMLILEQLEVPRDWGLGLGRKIGLVSEQVANVLMVGEVNACMGGCVGR